MALLIARGKTLLSQSVYRLILLVCGLFLVALSIYFVYLGIKFPRGKTIALSPSG